MNKFNRFLVTGFLVVLTLFQAPLIAAQSGISTTPINDIYGRALSINDKKEVLILGSFTRTNNSVFHPIIWSETTMKEVTVLGSETDLVVFENPPNSFNNNTEFIGYVNHTNIGVNEGFIYRGATDEVEYMGTQINGQVYQNIYPVAINNNSVVLGYYNDGTCYRVFTWLNGNYTVINAPEFGCYPQVTDINDSGVIIGYAFDNTGNFGFTFDPSTNNFVKIVSDQYSAIQPKSINNIGHVVGTAGYSTAFIWKDSVLTSLPSLGGSYSNAYSLNEKDEIVGESYLTDNTENHAVLWVNNQAIDLGVLSFDSPDTVSLGSTSLSINTEGFIVGTNYSYDTEGQLDIPVLYDYVVTKEKKPKKIKKIKKAVQKIIKAIKNARSRR